MTRRAVIFGKTPELMSRALARLSADGWQAQGAFDPASALDLLKSASPALLVIGGGVPEAERTDLRRAAIDAGIALAEPRHPGDLMPAIAAAFAARTQP